MGEPRLLEQALAVVKLLVKYEPARRELLAGGVLGHLGQLAGHEEDAVVAQVGRALGREGYWGMIIMGLTTLG